jgi:hypothetical protein
VATRRTTLAADPADLALLEDEARRRGVSLARVLRDLVAERADELRRQRRPRFGVVNVGSGVARESVEDEGAPVRERNGT